MPTHLTSHQIAQAWAQFAAAALNGVLAQPARQPDGDGVCTAAAALADEMLSLYVERHGSILPSSALDACNGLPSIDDTDAAKSLSDGVLSLVHDGAPARWTHEFPDTQQASSDDTRKP